MNYEQAKKQYALDALNEQRRMEEILDGSPRLRDIHICQECDFFSKSEIGCCCLNHANNFGHPWCSETVYPVTESQFEKVHTLILKKEKCLLENAMFPTRVPN